MKDKNPEMLITSNLASAAAAIARLDQALSLHPLAPAFLYRVRLDAVRRQAAVDGHLIDPWHLAATLEGLRLRMEPSLRIIGRGNILDHARFALHLHQWLVEPDFDQENEIQRAEALLIAQPLSVAPLLAAGDSLRAWLNSGEPRSPMRAAMIRYWQRKKLFRLPVPLTGAAALSADQAWDPELWLPTFLAMIMQEAADALDLLHSMEWRWFEARDAIAGRRKDAHDAKAVDLLAATPLLSATTLAHILGIAVKNAIRILNDLVGAGIAIEVSNRSKRRLFGLQGLTPLRTAVEPPDRSGPYRGRSRPWRKIGAPLKTPLEEQPPLPSHPLSPIERRTFDYSAFEEAMAHLDSVVRNARHTLSRNIIERPTVEADRS